MQAPRTQSYVVLGFEQCDEQYDAQGEPLIPEFLGLCQGASGWRFRILRTGSDLTPLPQVLDSARRQARDLNVEVPDAFSSHMFRADEGVASCQRHVDCSHMPNLQVQNSVSYNHNTHKDCDGTTGKTQTRVRETMIPRTTLVV